MSGKILHGPAPNHTVNISLGEFCYNSAERYKDRICQIDATLNKTESYSSVKERSIRVALELQSMGITSKDVIAFCSKVTLDTIIPILGSFYLGAKVANLDPSLSERQTTHLLSLARPRMVFVEESSAALVEKSLENANVKATMIVFGNSDKHLPFSKFTEPKNGEKEFKPVKVDIHDAVVLLFSSGSTGLPKIICHSHFSFLNAAYSLYSSGCRCDNILSYTSFYWISGLMFFICSLFEGGHRIFCGAMEAEKTFSVIEKYKVKYIFLAPILTYQLTNFKKSEKYNVSSVHSLILAGTPLSFGQFQKLKNLFKQSNVINAYGLTETGFITIFDPRTDAILIKTKIGSCGKPLPGFAVKVVDAESRKLLGPNEKGEICAKSPTVMKGYYNMDSSSVFDEDGFLKTGDIGYYDEDECFYIIERLKEMFKYMSWHVVPSVIEAVLLEHPAVKEAAVFGIPQNEEIGEVPTACVILKENCQTSKQAIEEFVNTRVADYEKLRGGVIFVESLIKTPTGKLMRKEIRKAILNSL